VIGADDDAAELLSAEDRASELAKPELAAALELAAEVSADPREEPVGELVPTEDVGPALGL